MYTQEFGLAMWRPGKTNVGDIGYLYGGEFTPLRAANIFDAQCSFESSEGITVSKYVHESGGVICAPFMENQLSCQRTGE
jgi:hypothetical protein